MKRDGGDHATFETAVGIPHTSVGVYGVAKGQTFKYKTQAANIDRMVTLQDAVLPGAGPRVKTWWDYLLCRPGKRSDVVVPQKITEEEGALYRDELTAWRLNGTAPASAYMIGLVARLEAELEQMPD